MYSRALLGGAPAVCPPSLHRHHSWRRQVHPSLQTETEDCFASSARRLQADARANNDSSRSLARSRWFASAQVRINGRGFVQDGILI